MKKERAEDINDIFSDLAGGNEKMHQWVVQARALWQVHANRRTKIIVLIGVIVALLIYLGRCVRQATSQPIL